MACYGRRHHHLRQQVLDVFKDEERSSKAIRFTGTTRNTLLEMGKHNHGFYPKATKNNKQLRHDLGNRDHQKELCYLGTIAYRLKPPKQLSRVHSTFHVPSRKKCLSGETLAIQLDEIQIDDTLHPIKEPVEIMNHEVKRLKWSRTLNVKMLRPKL
ncbi:hypothetical protein Tco_0749257 [Tanacetum coccineum]|uniref:Uncharacterized protein n=1 Tax=Tanacetum coccineum TaxID=301880 RepID=A0ABQ4YYW7_9ASTR